MRHARGGSRPFPVREIRELAGDSGIWCAVGVVRKRGSDPHYKLTDDDVLVDVEINTGARVLARLATLGPGPGSGIWLVPGEGAEVLVAFPGGNVDAEAVIVGILSTGQVADGTAPGHIVIAADAGKRVLVHDGNAGDAKPLTLKAEHDDHDHEIPALHVEINGAPIPVQVTQPAGTLVRVRKPAAITGTAVLRAK